MKSVISYPNRGKWGNSSWRGNCSGHVIKDLVEQFQPALFVDVCEGSGTSGDVCSELGIEYVGLDLHKGQDFTKDFVLNFLPRPADMCFSHPPYHDMISYMDNSNDTSRCASVDEFLEKSQMMLLNQREATRAGGIYTTLIGDQKKNGQLRSFQADYITMMPREELLNVVIKMQHNCVSDNRQYAGKFIPICHEYLLIWKKKDKAYWCVCLDTAGDARMKINMTWRNAVRIALSRLGGKATLEYIYSEVEKVAGHLTKQNRNWQAKIRQILQYHFVHVKRGEWATC